MVAVLLERSLVIHTFHHRSDIGPYAVAQARRLDHFKAWTEPENNKPGFIFIVEVYAQCGPAFGIWIFSTCNGRGHPPGFHLPGCVRIQAQYGVIALPAFAELLGRRFPVSCQLEVGRPVAGRIQQPGLLNTGNTKGAESGLRVRHQIPGAALGDKAKRIKTLFSALAIFILAGLAAAKRPSTARQ